MTAPIIVGNESENPFAIDIGRFCGQTRDIADLISLKDFANNEYCPRFIPDDGSHMAGHGLDERRVVIVSTTSGHRNRNDLAMRTLLTARAARDNGATGILLVEPDLFYSAQDRGPLPEQGAVDFDRDPEDFNKFDGQPFSARVYAQLLALAGVDTVVTVHNHSAAVGVEFRAVMTGGFHNLMPAPLFADYILRSDVARTDNHGKHLVLCAPDGGAKGFVESVHGELGLSGVGLLAMSKERRGERDIETHISSESPLSLDDIAGKDVLILDDMVRTGGTIVECCRLLREGKPRRVILGVSHFFVGDESRAKLNDTVLDEIVTTNTVPTILNRDMQGRLRKKMVVLKIERWIARFLLEAEGADTTHLGDQLFSVDVSSKNPRWRGAAGA